MRELKKDCKVKFKVVSFGDLRKTNSSLKIGGIYLGTYRFQNKSIWWTDPANDQNWVFWVGDTAEIIEVLD